VRAPNALLPNVPSDWRLVPLWTLFRREARRDRGSEELLSVYRDYGVIPKASRSDNFNKPSDDLDSYLFVEPGDLVVNKMKAWQGSMGISQFRGIVSPAYFVYRPLHREDGRFLSYLLRSQPMTKAYIANSKGIRINQWDLDPGAFSRLRVPLPPLAGQRAIADYLDRETAQIDTLIAEQQRLIELLDERRVAAIEASFACGVVNSRLRHACREIIDCPHTTPDRDETGVYEAVRTASVRRGAFRPGNGIPVSEAAWSSRNSLGSPELGDVLFTREAPAGEACMVPGNQICLGQRMVLLKVDSEKAVGEFVLWQIYSKRVQDHFVNTSNGSTVTNIRLPVLRSLPIYLPPLDEQRRIVAELDEVTSKIDTLIAEAERFIELAKERRSALITAAVTGQIDIPGVE